MTKGIHILKTCFSLLLIQIFAWMQFTAAAHTHDHAHLDTPNIQSAAHDITAHHIHDTADVSPHHFDHGEHKVCPPEDDHQDEPHNCSVCIIAAYSDETESGETDNPATDYSSLIIETRSFQPFEFEGSGPPYLEQSPHIIWRLKPHPHAQRAPPYSI